MHDDSNMTPLYQYLAIQPDDQEPFPDPPLAITDGSVEKGNNGNDPIVDSRDAGWMADPNESDGRSVAWYE